MSNPKDGSRMRFACKQCGGPLNDYRGTFCSAICFDRWYAYHEPNSRVGQAARRSLEQRTKPPDAKV